jgi:hypothetical protein
MFDLANDIRSLSEFKRNTVDLVDRLRKTGHPLVLTINDEATSRRSPTGSGSQPIRMARSTSESG